MVIKLKQQTYRSETKQCNLIITTIISITYLAINLKIISFKSISFDYVKLTSSKTDMLGKDYVSNNMKHKK